MSTRWLPLLATVLWAGQPSYVIDYYVRFANWTPTDFAVDARGWAYLAGQTDSPFFPVTPDAYDRTCGTDGRCNTGFILRPDAVFMVLDEYGRVRYATYLGGSNPEENTQVAVSADGTVWLAGLTQSRDFEGQPAPGCPGLSDVWVARLHPSFRSLDMFQCIGGSDADVLQDMALAVDGTAWLVGHTTSRDFPVRNALQPVFGGTFDRFVMHLGRSGGDIRMSTFVGGASADSATDVAIAVDGDVVIGGATTSRNFPVIRPIQPTLGSDQFWDGALVRLDATGGSLRFSTFLGGRGDESVRDVTTDASGDAFVVGSTSSPDFPMRPDAFDPRCGTDGQCNPFPGGVGFSDVFVTRVDRNGALRASTFLGGSRIEVSDGVVAQDGAVMVIGHSTSSDFPMIAPLPLPYARGEFDRLTFVTELDAFLQRGSFSTWLPMPDRSGGAAHWIADDGSARYILVNARPNGSQPAHDFVLKARRLAP